MSKILELLKSRPLAMDGAMGSLLMEMGMVPGECPELFNIEKPEWIRSIHQQYIENGADIIETNTFGGTLLKLKDFKLDKKMAELNTAGAQLAREVAGPDKFVAGSMGPTGKFIEPLDKYTFDQFVDIYAHQADALAKGGADILCIETQHDIQEARAALLGARLAGTLPVIISMTYDNTLRTVTGTDPKTAFTILASMGADCVGVNCSLGPSEFLGIIDKYNEMKTKLGVNTLILAMPNAGLPKLVNGKTIYPVGPVPFTDIASGFLQRKVNIIGSCCGSTPSHTAQIRHMIDMTLRKLPDLFIQQPTTNNQLLTTNTIFASRTRTIELTNTTLPLVIGERMNPTARKELKENVLGKGTNLYIQEAQRQEEAAADLLDVNVGVPKAKEADAMKRIVMDLSQKTALPLCIDSSNPAVLEAGLKYFPGRALINSVNGEASSLDTILPLAKKYGACVIGLTLDENGIPETAAGRFAIAERIVNKAAEYGIKPSDILIDTCVLTASARRNDIDPMVTLDVIPRIKKELGTRISLGVSNISFGLPKRKLVNHTFLAMALGAGADAIIANPIDSYLRSIIYSAALLTGRDAECKHYLENADTLIVAGGSGEQAQQERKSRELPAKINGLPAELKAVALAIILGDRETIENKMTVAIRVHTARRALDEGLIGGMEVVGEYFTTGVYYLPQVMASAEAMKIAFELARVELQKTQTEYVGVVVSATVKGDVHDIGKNIVNMMLQNYGFRVIDLGKSVESDLIIQTAVKEKADIIAVSALLTTTMPEMENIKKLMKTHNLKATLMVGGAVVTEDYARTIHATYGKNAMDAAERAKQLMKKFAK